MKQKGTPDAPRDTPYSDGPEIERNEFSNRLLESRREAVSDSMKMLFRGVKIRKRNALPRTMNEFIESSLPHCFSNLKEEKLSPISGMSGWVASLSEEILKHEHGIKIFEWAVSRAVEIANQEEGDAMPQAIIFLFEASSKVASLGKAPDVGKFFSAYKGMPISHLLETTQSIAAAKTYPELCNAVNMAHSESQQLKLSERNIVSNPAL